MVSLVHVTALHYLASEAGAVRRQLLHVTDKEPASIRMSSRDLLQRRATNDEGDTVWVDSPLIRAARSGQEGCHIVAPTEASSLGIES